jgi:hypothetical protein
MTNPEKRAEGLAPLFAPVVVVGLAVEVEVEDDGTDAADALEMVTMAVEVEGAAPGVVNAMVAPATSSETAGLNWPVMPLKLNEREKT